MRLSAKVSREIVPNLTRRLPMANKSFTGSYKTRLDLTVDGVNTPIVGVYPLFSYVRTGTNNPSHRQQILTGVNASTGMTVNVNEVEFDRPFTTYYWYSTNPYNAPHWTKTSGDLHPYWSNGLYNGSLDWESSELHRATESFLRRIREADRKFQAGVFFGEIVPTIRMLVRPFSTLRTGLGDYFSAVHRRGRGLSGQRLRRIIGDTWLEYAFGWQPLLADIKDATGALQDIYLNLRKEKVDSKLGGIESSTRIWEVESVVNLVYYQVYSTRKLKYSVKLYGKLNPLPGADKGIPYLSRLADQSNFRLNAFLPTVWELIPYSFLVDYFTNIGDVLAAYSTDLSELAWCSMVEKREASVMKSYEIDHYKQYVGTVGYPPGQERTPPPLTKMVISGQGGATTIRRKSIIRWQFGTIAYPGLRFDLPISAKKFANMAALLAGYRRFRG